MDRSFVLFFFFVTILFSGSQAVRSFQDILNLAIPRPALPETTTVYHTSHSAASVSEGAGDHSKTRVDFGTKGWPFIYYIRRDAKGTIDWGTLAWPYVYYSKADGKDDVTDAVIPSSIHPGRKVGSGF